MIINEAYKIKALLDSFLGNSKNELDDTYQLQYPCPKCVAYKGSGEIRKFNLEVNLRKCVYNSWCCSQYDDEMHGSIIKLIKLFGNDAILKEYISLIKQIKQSRLYDFSFNKNDFNLSINSTETKELILPPNFKLFKENGKNNNKALEYLRSRNIGWDIIKKYNIGYTDYNEEYKNLSLRIVIPSFNKYGELNYWVGRDFTKWGKRMKYMNPNVNKKEIIFNEEKICWDADITLVEGPFDHIVVPNSIPLLGKSLKDGDKLFYTLRNKVNSYINIWLDGDAFQDVKKIYKSLNHGKLYGKIRFIPTDGEMDPSSIYEKYGKHGIIQSLQSALPFEEKDMI